MNQFPVIEYDSHPGFSGLVERTKDQDADDMIGDIESVYTQICDQSGTPEARLAAFDRDITPRIDRLLRHIIEKDIAGPDFARFVSNAFANARQSLADYLKARTHDYLAHNSNAAAVPSSLVHPLADFRRDGFYVTRDAALAREIWSKTWVERVLLRAKKKKHPTRHCVLPLAFHSPGRTAIARAVEAMGMRKLVAEYLGKPVEFYYAALDHSHDGQNWHQNCYSDVGLATPKTVYMHFDAGCDVVKGMLYLQDVGANDGPFRFISGSHRWARPHFATAVQLGFDIASGNEFELSEDALDYSSGYYRPRFNRPEQRRAMMSLPAALRGSTHFGDDILDGSPISDAMLQAEHSFVEPAGTLVMFDGSRGIHRGGQAGKGGSRWAVQVAFRVAPPYKSKSRLRAFVGTIKGRLLYLRNSARDLLNLVGER